MIESPVTSRSVRMWMYISFCAIVLEASIPAISSVVMLPAWKRGGGVPAPSPEFSGDVPALYSINESYVTIMFPYMGMLPYFGPRMQLGDTMARRRVLLTDTERELLGSGEKSDQYYQEVSRVRRKIWEELKEVAALLEDHHPELLSELEAVVCEREE